MKKNILRVLCLILSSLFVLQCLSGCATKEKTDDTIYLTKGEFFAYFVYEKNLTSDIHTPDEVKQCNDGSIEADILVEWGYLDEKNAKKDLNKPVNKETVVSVCAKSTFDMKSGNVSEIKDADMLSDAQLIADAYACGFFELENGYFDGAEKMTFASCEEILNKAKEYAASYHYESNKEIVEAASDLIQYDGKNYTDGDIVLDFFDVPNEENSDVSGMSFHKNSSATPKISLLGTEQSSPKVVLLGNTNPLPYQNNLNRKGFIATIRKNVFENELHNPQVGDTVTMSKYQVMNNTMILDVGLSTEIIGVLKSAELIGDKYNCVFDTPNFEEAVTKKNVKQANGSGINLGTFVKEKTEVMGWKLDFDVSGNAIKVSAKKNFTVYETGRKQDWQNSKQTMTATANFSVSDFNLDINNLKSFANKNGSGYIKITCDTAMDFSLSSGLRYTPDDNRNGKFPSNWNNSRWTDSDSKGATEIKIARFSPSLYGIVGADIYIYLRISVDGKISFATSIDDGGVQITANNGKIGYEKLGKKNTELSASVNLIAQVGVDASLKLFSFINVIEYDVGGKLDLWASVNLYYEEELKKAGVFADQEGLDEYSADDGKFNYCIDASATLSIVGEMKDSGVKLILDLFSKGNSLNFTYEIGSVGIHFEDGHKVDKCTRGNESSENIAESKDDDIELSTYKIILPIYTCSEVELKSLPSETIDLYKSRNSITVKSNDESIVKVYFNKNSKVIGLDATGEGSTEIVITAKKGILWWKETVEQRISVTVGSSGNTELTGVSYSFPSVNEYEGLKVFAA